MNAIDENTVNYDVDVDADSYEEFIQKLREKLTCDRSPVHKIPLLMPSNKRKDPNQVAWLDINLTADKTFTISIKVDRVDLYLLGYKDSEGKFWKFGDINKDVHIGINADVLPFDGSYVGARGLVENSVKHDQELKLGYSHLRDAIISLSKGKERAKSLFILTQMICEACRFQLISKHLVANWLKDETLTSYMIELEKNYSKLSMVLNDKSIGELTDTMNFRISRDGNNYWKVADGVERSGIIKNGVPFSVKL